MGFKRFSILSPLIPLLVAALMLSTFAPTKSRMYIRRSASPAATQPAAIKGPWLLHLPGIGGIHNVDHFLLEGLRRGGVPGQYQIYDWTEQKPGIAALRARQQNDVEAAKISTMILDRRKFDPNDPITLTAHSGGCGLAVWALEKLPENCSIDTLVLLAPALSPDYDLTAALKHVRGKCYVLSSPLDIIILSTGTRLFGTIDGPKCDAAGLNGFVTPKTADPDQYKKLIPMPYQTQWADLGNGGEHIGSLATPFAQTILAPLLKTVTLTSATTQPDPNASKH